MLAKVNVTATDFPPDQDEFEWAGLNPAPSAEVRPFRVGEAKAQLDCELALGVSDGNTRIGLDRVIHAHVDPRVWKDGRVERQLLGPVCRLSGSAYASLGEPFSLARPAWTDLRTKGSGDGAGLRSSAGVCKRAP